MKTPYLILAVLILGMANQNGTAEGESLATADLAEIDRKLNNPLTSLWSLTFQNNTTVHTGDRIDDSEYSNNLFFQPFIPVALGEEETVMLTMRPVFPLVTEPVFENPDDRSSSDHDTGLGDIQLMTLAGPNDADGLVWGGGLTFKFPTASEDTLGAGKYQAGPAVMLFYMGKPWVAGILGQHWESFAGDDDRSDTSRTDLQYIIRRSIPGAMSIGMGPTVTINWEADSGNQLTLPIGLGITKTTRWGKLPVKLRAEAHYAVIEPDDYGNTWNFRLQVTPVINNPFK